MKFDVFCDICDKYVEVKKVRITKEGKMYLTLKCGHFSGFIFMGIIHLVEKPKEG